MSFRLPSTVHRAAAASLGMMAAAALLPAVASAATAPAAGSSGDAGGQIAVDTFTRTVSGGLGTADVGGSWRTPGGSAQWSTSGGVGRLAMPAPGRGGTSYLPAASMNTDLAATVSLTKAATGGGTYVSLLGRRIADQGTYQLDLKLSADQSLRLSLSRTVPGTKTNLGTAVTAVKKYVAGTPLHVRMRVRGSGTSTLLGKAWVGATEPSTWAARATDTTATLQAPGTSGLSGFLSTTAKQAQTVTLDDLSVTTPTTTITGPAGSASSLQSARTLAGPTSNLTNQSTQNLSFVANTAGSRFECQLDGAAWTSCPSPMTYSGLADGDHAFAVRAVDADGFAAPTASYSWTVDTTPPAVTVSGGPADGSLTSAKDAAFNLSSGEPAAFECQLDGAAWQPCDSSAGWTGLPDGSHDLAMRGTDVAGNTGPVLHRTWKIDATAPDTTVNVTPTGDATDTHKSMTATMTSTEPGTLECSLDAAAWSPCTSPLALAGLADGQHSFAVRATDLAGNTDQTPATTSWTTTTPAPTPTPPTPTPGDFVLRVTKPTAQNVGAGIIRQAPTQVATAADGTFKNGVLTITHDLKDRIVNGTVRVAANNLTIENCDIRGDVNNKPTGATWMVNTDAATGTLVRYNTIHSTYATPYLNGIGHRNAIAEYNDISRVTDGFDPAPGTGPSNVNMTIRGNYVHELQFIGNAPNHDATPTTSSSGVTITGQWAGLPWNHADIVQIEKDGTTGVNIYGNNFDATWANDNTSTLPLPNAVKELSVFMLNAGVDLHIEDNWLDGGEYAVNNADPNVTGTFARNHFGRHMAQKGTGDTSYFALMVTAPGLTTNDDTPNQNTWADTGNLVPRNKGR